MLVVAIIAILVSILMPSLMNARIKAMKSVCLANTSQVSRLFIMNTKNRNGRITEKELSEYPGNMPWDLNKSLWNDISDYALKDQFYCPLNPLPAELDNFWNWDGGSAAYKVTYYNYTYFRNNPSSSLYYTSRLRDQSDQGKWIDLISKVPSSTKLEPST